MSGLAEQMPKCKLNLSDLTLKLNSTASHLYLIGIENLKINKYFKKLSYTYFLAVCFLMILVKFLKYSKQ